MSRILLVNPPKEVPLLDWTLRFPPLGLMSIAASLAGHEVEILDMKVEKVTRKNLGRRLGSADIVGVTSLTPSIDSALEICRIASEYGSLTVLGGVHPSLVPRVVLNPEVDFVVRGEGELSFKDIADGKTPGFIPGISYVDGTTVVHNPDRPPADLNTLPLPRRDLTEKYAGRYKAFGRSLDALSSTRGCPYNCSFCCVPEVWHGYRQLSAARVVDEIKRMGKAEIVAIVDDNFCQDMGRVEEICDLVIRERLNDRLYSVFSRVDSIVQHPAVVQKMAAANMRVVFVGIEAATQAALDRMNKKMKIEDIHRACEILEKNGIMIWAGQIIGNLDDTYEDVEALIRMSGELPVDIAQFTVLTPYPGTDLYRLARGDGLVDEYDFTGYNECEPPMHTRHLSRLELTELEIKAYMRFYGFGAMAGRAKRWSGNREKRWILEGNFRGIRSFLSFRNKSAFYFWRTYKEMVGKTEGTPTRRYSPLVSTPVLYSIAAGMVAALVTLLLTIAAGGYYGKYSLLPLEFVFADLLYSSVLVASTTAIVATWFAVRSYRRGWIFSVRRRRPARANRSLFKEAVWNAVLLSAAAFAVAAVSVLVFSAGGASSRLTYGMKEVLVTAIAFATSLLASFFSIKSVRNGGIRRTTN